MDDIVVWGGNVYGNRDWNWDVWEDVSGKRIKFRLQAGEKNTVDAFDFDYIYYAQSVWKEYVYEKYFFILAYIVFMLLDIILCKHSSLFRLE